MKIGLGTVQFGQNYGVSNKQGITTEDEVREILALPASLCPFAEAAYEQIRP